MGTSARTGRYLLKLNKAPAAAADSFVFILSICLRQLSLSSIYIPRYLTQSLRCMLLPFIIIDREVLSLEKNKNLVFAIF